MSGTVWKSSQQAHVPGTLSHPSSYVALPAFTMGVRTGDRL
jgi:hypothetical protein